MKISLIAAVGKNQELGKNDDLLWHLPEDMEYFKRVTAGKTVIMGRKTWESIPEKFRPLPGRRNIILTRSENFPEGEWIKSNSLEHALEFCELFPEKGDDYEVLIIGGAQIYAEALSLVDRMYLTHVDAEDADADVFFPDFDADDFIVTAQEPGMNAEPRITFSQYDRK